VGAGFVPGAAFECGGAGGEVRGLEHGDKTKSFPAISTIVPKPSTAKPGVRILVSYHVRAAVPGDEPILRALRLEALAEAPDAFGSTYEREIARSVADWGKWLTPGVTLILEDDGTPRGLVAGVRDVDPAVVHLMAMWVHPALRGSGAADVLVAEHLAWARGVGADRIRLAVISTNHRARRLYQRHGFRATGIETVKDDGRRELEMVRSISETPQA